MWDDYRFRAYESCWSRFKSRWKFFTDYALTEFFREKPRCVSKLPATATTITSGRIKEFWAIYIGEKWHVSSCTSSHVQYVRSCNRWKTWKTWRISIFFDFFVIFQPNFGRNPKLPWSSKKFSGIFEGVYSFRTYPDVFLPIWVD